MKEVRGIDYLIIGLYAFAGLGIEVLYAFLLEPMAYGVQMEYWNVGQSVLHWIITCITWGVITIVLIKVARTKYGFNILELSGKMKIWNWIGIIICIGFSLSISYMDWKGFKIAIEFHNLGLLKFVFQYIYYVFETALFTLILIFGQKACEVWFKKENFPYGGIILALTWGLAHIFSKGSIRVGLLSALGGFTFGIVYLLANRDIKKTLPVLFIMFAM